MLSCWIKAHFCRSYHLQWSVIKSIRASLTNKLITYKATQVTKWIAPSIHTHHLRRAVRSSVVQTNLPLTSWTRLLTPQTTLEHRQLVQSWPRDKEFSNHIIRRSILTFRFKRSTNQDSSKQRHRSTVVEDKGTFSTVRSLTLRGLSTKVCQVTKPKLSVRKTRARTKLTKWEKCPRTESSCATLSRCASMTTTSKQSKQRTTVRMLDHRGGTRRASTLKIRRMVTDRKPRLILTTTWELTKQSWPSDVEHSRLSTQRRPWWRRLNCTTTLRTWESQPIVRFTTSSKALIQIRPLVTSSWCTTTSLEAVTCFKRWQLRLSRSTKRIRSWLRLPKTSVNSSIVVRSSC